MKTKKWTAVIVPHTHEGEWFVTFQQDRIRLVRLMNKVLDTLKRNPDFKFTLDGQVLAVEKYLKVYPERRGELKEYVRSGRLEIGPWYLEEDAFMVSPESTIRNLILGHQLAEELGKVTKVGYHADAYGHIVQMPQILKGFDIDSFVFWRGFHGKRDYDKLKTEFIWQSPDGTQVLGIWLLHSYVMPVNPVIGDYQKSKEVFLKFKESLLAHSATSNIIIMDGGDYVKEPKEEIIDIIKNLNKEIDDGQIICGTLSEYIQLVKSNLNDSSNLEIIKEELRSSKYTWVLPTTYSPRTSIKQRNVYVQTILEQWTEPFSTLAWVLGKEYPKGSLWLAWKYLLQNHMHDNIGGAHLDETDEDINIRYNWSEQIGQWFAKEALISITNKINTKGEISLVAYNCLGWSVTEVVTVLIDNTEKPFILKDPDGNVVPHQILETSQSGIKMCFLAENLPSCGYRAYSLSMKEKTPQQALRSLPLLSSKDNSVENDYFQVKIEDNGTLTIQDKESKTTYKNCLLFEDGGDAGDGYTYSPPMEDRIITNLSQKARVRKIENGPLRITFEIKTELSLPLSLVDGDKRRDNRCAVCPITSFVTLYAGIKRIDIKTEIVNKAKDHRLRVIFPTPIHTDRSHAESHFGVIEHPVQIDKTSPSDQFLKDMRAGFEQREEPMAIYPQQTFTDINDGRRGLTLINKGIPEYEAFKSKGDGINIALTLLRCIGQLSKTDLKTRQGPAGPPVPTPGAQSMGKNTFEYSLVPHTGTYQSARTYQLAHQFVASPKVVMAKKRSLVPDKKTFELLVRSLQSTYQFGASPRIVMTKDCAGQLPEELSFISVTPESLVISAIKKAEENSTIVVRLYNITGKVAEGSIKTFRPIVEAKKLKLNEEPIESISVNTESNDSISIKVNPFEIFTVGLSLKGPVENGMQECRDK